MDVFISGIPLEMQDNVILDKLTRKYNLRLGPYIRATCYGHVNIRTGERIVKVPITQLKQVPTAFYLLGWLIKTWYKGCENHRPCPRCKKLGHYSKGCMEEYKPRQNSYAEVVTGRQQDNTVQSQSPTEKTP
ncbi:hypothetical protein ACJMK2_034015 [Sinanodonta woodiana]|uniref:CCHC-type domain-containing protein n=1 Tax=Sinanodonta woodiana TaxID=1069815 RepID=A0ABD3WTS1_SINWO